ncbi:hypothetical protein TRFO_09489 [Tritrichomonas foetus]|uniref:Uncharacterized protein n=1 Tax=Tritrichomonas foetus TaxID=1144522 RepID=A0A1J4JDG9_9EUKA|nr:hypothetical protein TRFO_09489 [Tritrichomonas foetus]|eukprot:OHS97246.1 hypothetical protein TRFO_09489 [Tritrichomonas foetus]
MFLIKTSLFPNIFPKKIKTGYSKIPIFVKDTFTYSMSKLSEAQRDVMETAELIGMIYPGIQSDNNTLISRNAKFFAYATIISVYVYEQNTMNLINIITTGKDSIATISFAQKSPYIIATSFGSCKKVEIIDVIENQQISQFSTSDAIVSFGWSNQDSQIICFSKYYCHFFIYDVASGSKVRTHVGNFGNIRVMAFTNTENPIYFGGNNNGTITRVSNSKVTSVEFNGRSKVVASAIDPNNAMNCLIVWKQSWGIFDITSGINLVHEVNDLSYSFGSATWSSFIPGQFFTGDEVSGIVRVWNASSTSPLEILSIHTSGVTSLLDLKKNRLLLGFADGMIGVYDVENRKFVFQNIAGHSNTIFRLQFHPTASDIIISSGGEGSICTWNVSTMKQIDRLVPPESLGSLFSMDVSPGGGMICCGYKGGRIAFFSLQTKAKIFDHVICEQRIISLCFSNFDPELIMCSSDKGFTCVFNIQDRKIIWRNNPRYNSNIGVFSPHNKGQMLVTTHGGAVLVYDGMTKEPAHIIEDSMHSDLYFIAFHPNDKDIFATSDNSGFIKIWHLCNGTVSIIGQHKGKSRPICFHPQLGNILASSGYDNTIMIHDLKAKQVICSFTGHPSIIYSLAFSPSNPNLLVSAAADSSIKFWTIDTLQTKTFLTRLLNCDYGWIRPLEGNLQLLKLAKRCMKLDDKLKFNQSDVPHINDILRLTKKTVQRSMSGSLHETRLIKRALKNKERMVQSAKLELFMGNAKHYSELMFTTGEFDLAVAAAPAVSVRFWSEMMKNRAKLFENQNDIANYQLLIGDVNGAIDTLVNANETDKAFLVAAAQKRSAFQYTENEVNRQVPQKKRQYIDKLFEDPSLFIEYITASERAKQCLEEGQVYIAAAAFLSIGDVVSAEFCLMQHGQTAAAFLLDLLTKTNNPTIRGRFAMLCIQSGAKRELFKYLTDDEKLKFAIAVNFKTPNARSAFYSEYGLRPPSEYSGGETDYEKLHNLLLAGKINEACEFMVATATEKMKTHYCEVEEMVKLIEIANLNEAEENNYFSIVCLSLYFGMYRAIWKGYRKIFKHLQARFADNVKQHNIEWAKDLIVETKKAIELFEKMNNPSRLYYVGYKYLNARQIGVAYKQSSMYGRQYYLEDGMTTMSMEETLMWFDSTPFSPLTFKVRHYVI